MKRSIFALVLFAVAMLGSWNCGGSTASISRFAYVLNNPGQLARINLFTGSTIGSNVTLTGNLRNIAVRPTDGVLYALGTDLNLYTVDPISGTCVQVSASPLAIDGHNGGMTFESNSTVIRFVTVNSNNYRINSNDGTLISTQTDANDSIVGLALRTASGEFYAYTTSDTIVKSLNIDSGVFVSVGNSGVDLSGAAGMAFDPSTGNGYVVANEGLFGFNVGSGHLTQIDTVSRDDIAVIP